MTIINKKNALFFLVVNTLLWGSAYVWSKMVMDFLPPITALLICEIAGLIFAAVVYRHKIKHIDLKIIKICTRINIFYVASNIFYMFALLYTTSSNVSFIIQLTVVIVPLIVLITGRRKMESKVALSSASALVGLLMLTVDFSNFTVNKGDILALLSAVSFSIYLVRMNQNSDKVDAGHVSFLFYALSVAILPILILIFERKPIDFASLNNARFLLIVFSDVIVGIFTVLIQNAAAKYVVPEKTTVIYCLEPVFTIILAFILLGEVMNVRSVIGSAFIIFAVYISRNYENMNRLQHASKSEIDN